jgi:translocation and assembly module TamB
LSEQFDGRVLGLVTGRQVVQTHAHDTLPAADDSLSGVLEVKIGNLRPWGVWAPPGWRLSGQLQADAQISGTLGAPLYKGQVSGQNLGAGHALLGVNFTDGTLQMSLDGDHAHLTQFKAKSGENGGTISLDGDAVLGAKPEAHLNLLVDHFALLQRVDRRVLVSGQAQVALGAEDVKADGRFKIDEGLIDISKADAPTIGDDVNVINRPGDLPQDSEQARTASALSSKRKLQVTLDVDLGNKLRLKGRGLNAVLVGSLRLTTPNGRPAVQGTIKTESGSYVAYAQNLVIERGSISFTGPIENPRLDILAMRAESPTAAASDVKVGVTITGTAQDPRVRLYSDPSMSETEKLSWLVLGRGPVGLGGADIGLLQTAASALLAGEGGSPKDSVLTAIGLDNLSVQQTDGDARETVVNVGKQISRNWYLGYERSLNATAGNWQVIYRLAQRFTLRAQAGQDNALDLIWSWRFD